MHGRQHLLVGRRNRKCAPGGLFLDLRSRGWSVQLAFLDMATNPRSIFLGRLLFLAAWEQGCGIQEGTHKTCITRLSWCIESQLT